MRELERERVKLHVRFAKQQTPHTCAPKALQMVLSFHNPECYDLGKELEIAIFEKAKLGHYNAATTPGLAVFALEEGFPVDHIVKFKEAFKYPDELLPGYTMPRGEFDEKVAIDALYFERARALGLNTVVVPDIGARPAFLKSYLQRGIPLIAMLDIDGLLHDVVIRGFFNEVFLITDPAAGQRSIPEGQLMRYLDTRYGVSILAIYSRQAAQV